MNKKFYFRNSQRPVSIQSIYILFFMIGCLFGLFTNKVSATPLPSELTISGELIFDTAFSAPVTGNAFHNATLSQTIADSTVTTTVNDTTISGTHPLIGNLTDNGDGWAIQSAINGNFTDTAAVIQDDFYDLFFSLENFSATDDLQVTIKINFDNNVDAAGEDAFADSEIEFFDSLNNLLFFSDLTSDALFGNRFNSADRTGEFGGPLHDSGQFLHNVTLNPGELLDFHIVQQTRGGAFVADTSFSAFLDTDITFEAVNITNPPSPVSEPNIIALLSAGLLGFLFKGKMWRSRYS